MPNLTSREPVAVAEGVRAVLIAGIALGPAFHLWNLTDEQVAALLTMYVAISGLLAMFARAKSTPTSSVALTNDQVSALEKATPPPGPVPVAAAVGATPRKRPAKKAAAGAAKPKPTPNEGDA